MASDIGFPGNFIRFVCQLHKALFTTICVYRQKPSFNVLFDDYLVTVMDINTLNRWLAVKAASVEGIPAVSLTTVGDAYVVDAGHHLVIIEVYHETVDKCWCKLLARYLETGVEVAQHVVYCSVVKRIAIAHEHDALVISLHIHRLIVAHHLDRLQSAGDRLYRRGRGACYFNCCEYWLHDVRSAGPLHEVRLASLCLYDVLK